MIPGQKLSTLVVRVSQFTKYPGSFLMFYLFSYLSFQDRTI